MAQDHAGVHRGGRARGPAGGGGDLSTAGLVAVAFSALVWLAFLRVAHWRVRALGAGPRPRVMSDRAALAAVACTIALAGFAVAMVV